MKNELEQMDYFIKVQISPDKLKQNATTQADLDSYISFAKEENLRVCNVILTEVYELNLCQKGEAYIQLQQTELSNLIDILQQYASSSSKYQSFYSKIEGELDAVTTYIQAYHNKYIDHDLPIPQSYHKLLVENLPKTIKEIEEWVESQRIDHALLEIVLRPVKVVLNTNHKISFRKAEYIQELTKGLLGLKISSTKEDSNKRFHEALHIINFNSPDYIYYCTTALNRKLGEEDNQQKKLELLQWYIKTINQQPIREGYALFPNLLSVCKTMLIWINEEYKHLVELNGSAPTIGKKPNGVKISTSLSVPQLAVVLKLFILSGIITNETYIEVIRFVAENFTTVKTDDISDESLRSKYYNPEPEAVGVIKEKLAAFSEIIKKL